MSPSLSWFELSPVRRERSRKAALVACMLVAIACDDKKTEDNPAASASASVAVTPSATPPPAPARPPLLSLDDSAVTVQGDKIDFTGDAKGKLTAALLGNPRVAHEMIELQAIRDAKVARVQIVISAIKAAKAKGVTLKTATRELSTLGQIDIVFDHAPAPACSVVGLVGKDSSIMVWSIGGGTAQRFGAGECHERTGQPRIHADERAPIGLVGAVRAAVARRVGKRLQRLRHGGERGRVGELGAELMHLGEVEAKRGLALPCECRLERGCAHERVAVAIATDPVAHAKEVRDRVPRQQRFDVAIEHRDLRQERCAVVAEGVLDLVVDGELGREAHPVGGLRDGRQRAVLERVDGRDEQARARRGKPGQQVAARVGGPDDLSDDAEHGAGVQTLFEPEGGRAGHLVAG